MQKTLGFSNLCAFFANAISQKRRATQRKKLQSNVSQVKRNPHGKIQLFLRTFKNSQKIKGMFLPAPFQLCNIASHWSVKIILYSHVVFGFTCTCVEFPCYIRASKLKRNFFARSVLSPELKKLILKPLAKFKSFSDYSEFNIIIFVGASNLRRFVPV